MPLLSSPPLDSITFTPVAPLNKKVLSVLDSWNNDALIKQYLATCGEPRRDIPIDSVLLKARIQMFRSRMFELDALRARTLAEGRDSEEVDRELAAILYKRKLLLCMTFPILDLPSEILSIIFRSVVWSSFGADQANTHRLNLTWVCRRFRDVAMNDQTLWNSIWFRDAFPWTRSFEFIKRSGTAPLDIRIDDKDKKTADKDKDKANEADDAITLPQIDLILNAILPKIRQIRILVVLLKKEETVERFVTRFSTAGHAVWLERYEVHRCGEPYLWPHHKTTGSGGIIPLSVFPTPKLRWLAINGIPVDWETVSTANLVTLDLRRMPIQACPPSKRWLEMLRECPSLYKLHLEAAGPQLRRSVIADLHLHINRLQRVHLPSLRELILGDVSCAFGIYLLAHMHAPRVMSLTLTHLGKQNYSDLVQYTTGLFPELRILSLWTLETPQTDDHRRLIVRWLESMPHIKMLKVAEGASRFLLDSFSKDPEHGDEEMMTPVLLPELEYLFFQTQLHIPQATTDDLSALVVGRSEMGKPFHKVYVPDVSARSISEAELDKVRAHSNLVITYQQGILTTEEEVAIHSTMLNSLEPGHPLLVRRMMMN
ncbi:hypothetical protein C8Q80DRAFT_1090501 [Daedaleopsis nitida]|nr:hypothetical protein C8Q80DRAFT_1090501 [Daedaleopsis nitida]